MKNASFILLIIFILLIAVTYVFIPVEIPVSKLVFVKSNRNATNRSLTDSSMWQKWWPSSTTKTKAVSIEDTIFKYKDVDYLIKPTSVDVINITVRVNEDVISSRMHIIPLHDDSVALEWKSLVITGLNPLKKVRLYFAAKRIRRNMTDILESAKNFLEKPENIYGVHITEEKVTDTILIATRLVSDIYPGTSTIYNLIKNLKKYISSNGAIGTNYPMLHISKEGGFFETMVAIPTNKRVPENTEFLFKKMVPGKILVAEVKGGRYATENALATVELYLNDNQLSSPAIPFQSLITDRSEQPDTLQWTTKIFYPIY